MHPSSRMPLPFPASLVASALGFAAALILFGLAVLHWRHAGRLAPIRARRVAVAWRLLAVAWALMGLGVLGLVGLSLVYPFDGRNPIIPPGDHAGLALEVVAYAMAFTGLVMLPLGSALLGGAYP